MSTETQTLKHTPGPWTLVTNLHTRHGDMGKWAEHTYSVYAKDKEITGCGWNIRGLANASLIAAAPDLLGVLKGATCDLGTVADYLLALNDQESADLLDVVNGLVERIEAAIAKAEGK